nr:DNA-directed DNA polymerase [Tanacetum cinerariifolium]
MIMKFIKFIQLNFLEDPPVDPPEVPMADNQTMVEFLQAPTEGYEDAILILEIAANNFELKHDLINLVQNKQFFGHDKEDPHAHIRYFNKITSMMRVPNVPSSSIKIMLFPFSLEVADRIWLEKEAPRSILTWDDLVTKIINQFFPPSKTTNLHNEITRFQQSFDESFYEAWDRFNDLLRSKFKVRQSRAKAVVAKVSMSSSTPSISSEVSELKDLVRALLLDKKNQSSTPAQSSTPVPVKEIKPNYVTCGGAHSYQNCPATRENVYRDNIQDGAAYQGPPIPTQSKVMKQGTEVSKDQVQTPSSQSTAPVKPQIAQPETQTPVAKPVVAPISVPIPYPLRRDNERRRDQANEQIKKFYKIFKEMSFEISFTDALILMLKFASTLKALIGKREKLRMDECLALVDLGASINLMPLSVWEGLSLSELTLTCMTLELVDRSVSKPICIAKDVSVKVGVFHFPADFVVVVFEPDPPSPLNSWEEADAFLGLEDDPDSPKINPFYYDPEGDILLLEAILNSKPLPPLPNHKQYMPLYKKELKVCEAKTVKSSVDEPPKVELKVLPPHLEYVFLEGDNKFPVIIAKELGDEEKSALIKVLKSHNRAIARKLSDIQGINLKFCTHKILMEEEYKPAVQHQRRVNPKIHDVIKKEVEKLLDAGLIYPISDSPWVSPVHCVPKKEKTTFTYPYGTFAYRRIPFGLCNAPGTFQRYMLAIFHDMVEKTMEVFMDDFSVFGNYIENCLSHLDKMMQRCEETNLSLNWEKSHFMVKEGIILGHKISKNSIKVDRAKVDVISKLPHPTTVKDVKEKTHGSSNLDCPKLGPAI